MITRVKSRDRADGRLPGEAVDRPVHLCKQRNGNDRSDNAADRGEERMLETERGENVAARHHQKAGEPCACEFFNSRANQPARARIVQCEDTQPESRHRLPLSSSVLIPPQLVWCATRW